MCLCGNAARELDAHHIELMSKKEKKSKISLNRSIKFYRDSVNLSDPMCFTAAVLGHLFAEGILHHKFWRWKSP